MKKTKKLLKEILQSQNKQTFNLEDSLKKAEVPVIPIYINGKEYFIMLDTGSDASYLDSEVLNNIPKLLLGHQEEIVGGTAIKESGSCVYEVEFACGDREFKEVFTENDFSHIFNFLEQTTGIKLSGILGTRFLMKHKCILDFDQLVFYL